MARRSVDVAAELARLTQLTTFELRNEWRHLNRQPPPLRLSCLLRGITYRLQERALGGLSKTLQRKLRAGAGEALGSTSKADAAVAIRPGMRLVREWRGVTNTVLVLANGVEWRGKRYRSLSVVAREITGAHWSGPQFRAHAEAGGRWLNRACLMPSDSRLPV